MNLQELKASLPDYAKDLRLNLDSVLGEGTTVEWRRHSLGGALSATGFWPQRGAGAADRAKTAIGHRCQLAQRPGAGCGRKHRSGRGNRD